jgi:hypothetical protein
MRTETNNFGPLYDEPLSQSMANRGLFRVPFPGCTRPDTVVFDREEQQKIPLPPGLHLRVRVKMEITLSVRASHREIGNVIAWETENREGWGGLHSGRRTRQTIGQR